MKAARVTLSLIAVLILLAVFLYKRWQEPRTREAFDRSPDHLAYTKHALCRMNCRHISREEIDEIMHKGVINLNKSNRFDKPCPTYALQGTTTSGERLRIIFAQCEGITRVVTCYNLEEDPPCDCPVNSKNN